MQRVQQITGHLTAAAQAAPAATAAASAPQQQQQQQEEVWIVGYARTPIGSAPLGGALSGFTAPQLGGLAIQAAVKRAGIRPAEVEELMFGCVLTAGIGQAPARQAALAGGLPIGTPCTTVNKVCASAMKALQLGTDAIRAGSRSCVVVGGMESMSNGQSNTRALAHPRHGL
jgi:acetyl-CoA C-acetyltransferase